MNSKLTIILLLSFIMSVPLIACGGSSSDSGSSYDSGNNSGLNNIYMIVDTGQDTCYGTNGLEITCPSAGESLYGQDAQYSGNQPDFTDNGDGTITDNVTGLMWQQSPDTNGDGNIDADDKMTYGEGIAQAPQLQLGGYMDWRLPTIKELYSLIDFRGINPNNQDTNTSNQTPFIDTGYFEFGYGDINAGERIIDAQFMSSTEYVSTTMMADETLFGVNFADGRIKGYPIDLPTGEENTFYVRYVRGSTDYGVNNFSDNGDGSITDSATGLMWSQDDSGEGLDWQQTLEWVQARNEESYLGYSDWRLPNVKELQGIVDYSRSPDATGSAAIDDVFNTTAITNENDETDFAWYWSSTTHITFRGGYNNTYVAFGRAMGYMHGQWMDVHGAGCQRSDPKVGNPDDYPTGHGPQGDAIRIYNYVRLVRDAS